MGRAIAKGLIVVLVMLWLPGLEAGDEVTTDQKVQAEAATAADTVSETRERKGKGMQIFWVVLGVSLLFVLGSALALNGLGDKRPPRREDRQGRDSGEQ